jgi:hypothetical protein
MQRAAYRDFSVAFSAGIRIAFPCGKKVHVATFPSLEHSQMPNYDSDVGRRELMLKAAIAAGTVGLGGNNLLPARSASQHHRGSRVRVAHDEGNVEIIGTPDIR